MTRIGLKDTTFDVISKMSDGNPGAINVMATVINHGAKIDPDNGLGGVGYLLSMDTAEMYGPDIWIHWKDICGQNLDVFLATFRAKQLGLRRSLIERVDTVVADVQAVLPNFALNIETEDHFNDANA